MGERQQIDDMDMELNVKEGMMIHWEGGLQNVTDMES